MNVSINPPGPQLYVEISSLAAQIASANSVEDVHICGSCKRNFSDIEQFVEHKRVGCSNTSQKALPSSVVPSHTQSSLGYVTNNASGTNDDSISSLGPQYLRVIFDAANLNIDENQPVDQQISSALPCSTNSEQDILRNRLLELSKQDSSMVNHDTFPTTNELHSLVLADNQQSNNSKREFQIDEEDVATLLANQLASEVVSSVNETSITSKTGLIDISSNIGQKSQGHYNLESVNLPIATSEAVSKDVINKKISDKKKEASKGQDAYPDTQGSSKWSTGNKSKSSKSIAPVSVSSVVSSESNSTSASTKSETENHNTVNSSGLVDSSTGRRRHKCNHEACDFTTLYFKDLIRHVRKHTGERPYQCYFCHRSFSRLDKLHVHERIHTGEKKYQCNVCDYATCDSGSLRKHMRIHNNERPYKCQMCTYRSRDSSQLTVHLRTHTGDNPFVCPVADCSSAFKTSSDLKRHSRTHTGEKPFACQLCDYRCSIKTNLRIHMLHNHSESKTSSCKFCKHVCSTKRELKEHEKTHAEILKCGLCSYTCISTASMRSHHKTHSEDKYFSCKQCSFTCQVAVNLKMHVKKKHPEVSRKKGKGSNKESSSDSKSNVSGRAGNKSNSHLKLFCVKSFKCTFCDAAFVREDSWRSHIRQHKNLNESLLASSNSSSLSTATETTKKAKSSSTETTVTVEVHPVSQKETVESLKVNLSSSSEYLELNYNESTLKESESFIPEQIDKNVTDNVVATSEIDSSFVQYSVSDKNDKGELQIVHQINSEVLDRDSMSNQPILLYVQNAPVLHGGLDSNLRNAEILASINPPTPILVGRCGQYLSVPLDQGGSIVEQFTSSLPQGMQYIVSAPFDGVVESNPTYLQPLDSAETSGNPVSVVSFQVDKNSTAPTQESEN